MKLAQTQHLRKSAHSVRVSGRYQKRPLDKPEYTHPWKEDVLQAPLGPHNSKYCDVDTSQVVCHMLYTPHAFARVWTGDAGFELGARSRGFAESNMAASMQTCRMAFSVVSVTIRQTPRFK